MKFLRSDRPRSSDLVFSSLAAASVPGLLLAAGLAGFADFIMVGTVNAECGSASARSTPEPSTASTMLLETEV